MPRSRVVVTNAWQEVNGALACVITVDKMNRRGFIELNETPDNNTALKTLVCINSQFWQCEDKSVFVRSDDEGFEIVVDVSTPVP